MLGQPRMTQRYKAQRADDEGALVKRIHELVGQHPRFGYRRIWAILKYQEGWRVNRKRIWRLWQQEHLKVPQRQHKKQRLGTSESSIIRQKSMGKNDVWAIDFIFDRTANGRSIKWLSVIDEYTPGMPGAGSRPERMNARDVIDVLNELMQIRGVPGHIRSDNGPEFIARRLRVGWRHQVPSRCILSRAVRGRTGTPRASMRGCGMNY